MWESRLSGSERDRRTTVTWMRSCGTAAKAGGKQRTQTSSWSHGSLLSTHKPQTASARPPRCRLTEAAHAAECVCAFLPSYVLTFLPSYLPVSTAAPPRTAMARPLLLSPSAWRLPLTAYRITLFAGPLACPNPENRIPSPGFAAFAFRLAHYAWRPLASRLRGGFAATPSSFLPSYVPTFSLAGSAADRPRFPLSPSRLSALRSPASACPAPKTYDFKLETGASGFLPNPEE